MYGAYENYGFRKETNPMKEENCNDQGKDGKINWEDIRVPYLSTQRRRNNLIVFVFICSTELHGDFNIR
jgi:hypothetical protein